MEQTPQRLRSQKLEELTCASVLAHLRSEGRSIERPYRPIPGTSRSPDFLVTIDGEPVALEIVRFLPPPEVGKADARIRSIEKELKLRLQADAVAAGTKVVLTVSYAVAPLQAYGRPQAKADADLLAAEIRDLLDADAPEARISLPLNSDVSWVISADVSIWLDPHPSVFIGVRGSPEDLPDPAEFVDRTIRGKGDQHLAFSDRGILAVAGGSRDEAALEGAFRTSPLPVPWWRVYFVLTGGEAALLYESGAGH
jgi:hypothetical protein